ncbi:hypothetical protein M8312_12465 [Sphingomonas sp. KRR8]|uniref:hypothetical protein n=1 Tax=Sphingomonas sp. KRR8 TaxID=2942996 RepID=UPI002021524F|nr:hypothetical protein [Sphingomonas sp. KRR8]URD60582.1 hypothetical protein M8312_12465 [Sphingomonas sp. KRR8]
MADDGGKRDFLIFTALRLSGAAIFILGVAITYSDLVAKGGMPFLGIPMATAGLAEALFAPRIVRRLKA